MAFQQGLSGLNTASKNLDVIGNNVANASTIGFKPFRAQFADVFAASLSGGGNNNIGIGSAVSAVAQQFLQGNITVTDNPMDVAINGAGFFRLSNNGAISYTRNGQFQVDKDGFVVNDQGRHLTGYGVDSSGNIVQSSPTDIQIDTSDLTPSATSTGVMGINLNANDKTIAVAFDPTDSSTFNRSTSTTIYDSLGNAHTQAFYFVKTAANTWNTYQTIDGTSYNWSNGNPNMVLTFDTNGALATINGTAVATSTSASTASFTLAGASAQTITFDLSGMTQYGSTFSVNKLTQNGFSSGRLNSISISSDGTVQGKYTNGQSRNMAQIVLANFSNPQGLQPKGGNEWVETPTSGQPLVGAPATSSLGVLQSSALEESKVDLTQELVNMITAQRSYQANAQTIKTQDQVMQTLVNLR